jgi:hypothetical protein
MRYESQPACFDAAQQADVQVPVQPASHAAVHWLLPLQQSAVAVVSSAMMAAKPVDAAVHFAAAGGMPAVAVVAEFCFAHGHSLQPPHWPLQLPVVAVVETTVAVAAFIEAGFDAVADSHCWQHDFSQLHPFSQLVHSAAAVAADSVAVICSMANTLVANAVRINTGSVVLMSFSP